MQWSTVKRLGYQEFLVNSVIEQSCFNLSAQVLVDNL